MSNHHKVFRSTWPSMTSIKRYYPLYILLVTLVTVMGCGTPNAAMKTTPGPTTPQVHIALSGGGWRAHTGHSAWIMSLLNNGQISLNEALQNVGAISSNSGGSWFSSKLMFSSKFDKAISAPNAITNWKTTGWLGQQQGYFLNAGCRYYSGNYFLPCVFDEYTGSISNAFSWIWT